MTSDVAKKEQLAAARATASQIRQGIHNYLATLSLIARANQEQHWRVLGYADWRSYVDGEFGAERLRLPAEHRQKAIEELRLAGLSTRAIGTVVGVSESTVRRDLSGASFDAPETTTGTDGKTYAASRQSQPSATAEADGQLDAPGLDASGSHQADGGATPEAADSSVEDSGEPSTDGEEEQRVPALQPDSSDAAGAPAHFPAAGAPDPKTAAEPDIASADAAHSDVGLGTDAQRPGSDVAGGVAAPAPAVLSSAGAGVNPSDLVNKVLDALVPDDNPHREWQRRFLADIHAVHRLLRHDVDVVAAQADSQCIDEMGRIFTQVDEYRSKVLAALKASLPDNVTQLRRSS
jgi:hypothetical protein